MKGVAWRGGVTPNLRDCLWNSVAGAVVSIGNSWRLRLRLLGIVVIIITTFILIQDSANAQVGVLLPFGQGDEGPHILSIESLETAGSQPSQEESTGAVQDLAGSDSEEGQTDSQYIVDSKSNNVKQDSGSEGHHSVVTDQVAEEPEGISRTKDGPIGDTQVRDHSGGEGGGSAVTDEVAEESEIMTRTQDGPIGDTHVYDQSGGEGGDPAVPDGVAEESEGMIRTRDGPIGDTHVHDQSGDEGDGSAVTDEVAEESEVMTRTQDGPIGVTHVYDQSGGEDGGISVSEEGEEDSKGRYAGQDVTSGSSHDTQSVGGRGNGGPISTERDAREFGISVKQLRRARRTKRKAKRSRMSGVSGLLEDLAKGRISKQEGSPRLAGCSSLQGAKRTDTDFDVVLTTAEALARTGVQTSTEGGGVIFPVFSDVAKVRSMGQEPVGNQEAKARESTLKSRGFIVPVADMFAAVRRDWSELPIDCGVCTIGAGYLPVRLIATEKHKDGEILRFADVEYPSLVARGTLVSIPAAWLIMKGNTPKEWSPGAGGFILCLESGDKPVFVAWRTGLFSQYTEFRAQPFRERVSVVQSEVIRGTRQNESVLEAKLTLSSRGYFVNRPLNRDDYTFMFFGTVKGPPVVQSLLVKHALNMSDKCVIEREIDGGPVSLDCKGWRKFEKLMRKYEEGEAAIAKDKQRRQIMAVALLGLGIVSGGFLYAGHRKERGHGLLRMRPSHTMRHKLLDRVMERKDDGRRRRNRFMLPQLREGVSRAVVPGYVHNILSYIDAMHPVNLLDAAKTLQGHHDIVSQWVDWGSGRREAAKGVLYKGVGGYGMATTGVLGTILALYSGAKHIYGRSKQFLIARKAKNYVDDVLSQKKEKIKRRRIVFLVVR
uniref:Transmembrane protein n=1 Tax=Neospora caninum (strain Liverpool) TaxID=572307 RepID=A0A0F7UF97_NEOCL|nr:TPA: hypothetical protein BN1204_027600 [Neospora caninum Liverpool]